MEPCPAKDLQLSDLDCPSHSIVAVDKKCLNALRILLLPKAEPKDGLVRVKWDLSS